MNFNIVNVNNRTNFGIIFSKNNKNLSDIKLLKRKNTVKEQSKASSEFVKNLNKLNGGGLQGEPEIKTKEQYATYMINNIKGDLAAGAGDIIDYLSKQADMYEKYSKELEKSNISNEEKNKIKSQMAEIEKNIKYKMSPEIEAGNDKIISVDKFISLIDKVTRADVRALNGELDVNINASKFLINSMQSLGLSFNKNDDMNTIIKKIRNASGIMEYKVNQLNDLEKKYGVSSGKYTLRKERIKNDENKKVDLRNEVLQLAKKIGLEFNKNDDLDSIIKKINDFINNKDTKKKSNNKKIDVYV